MNHSGETKKHRLGRKQFILLIVSVCLVALLAEAVLLIHTFSKKGDKERKLKTSREGTVWRVKEARLQSDDYIVVYSFEYDEKGREIVRSAHIEENDGTTRDSAPRKIKYFAGGCGLYWNEYADYNDTKMVFFTEDPLIVTRVEWVSRYETDEQGRLTILETSDSGVDRRWTFDEEGRPTRVSASNGEVTRYSYDTEGRLVQIKRELVIYESESGADADPGQDVGDPYYSADANSYTFITYDNDTRIVSATDRNGVYTKEEEYVGGRLIRSVSCDDKGEPLQTQRIYYPKGNFIFTGTECWGEFFFTRSDDRDLWSISLIDYDSVKFTKDGQLEAVLYGDDEIRIKNCYDKNGLLYERLYYDRDDKYSYEYDDYGNLIHFSAKRDSKDYTFTWVEIELKTEQEGQ